jgi:hypothetical protein
MEIIATIILGIIAPITIYKFKQWDKKRQAEKAMPNLNYFIKEIQKFTDSHYPKKK